MVVFGPLFAPVLAVARFLVVVVVVAGVVANTRGRELPVYEISIRSGCLLASDDMLFSAWVIGDMGQRTSGRSSSFTGHCVLRMC